MSTLTTIEQVGVVAVSFISITAIYVGVSMYRYLTSVKSEEDEALSAQELKDKIRYDEELAILRSFNKKKSDDESV